jgi:uncharacterized protein YggT (Ycf19 family)
MARRSWTEGGYFPGLAGKMPADIRSPAMPFEIQLVTILRALLEVAGFALIGQGLLALLAGKYRHDNAIYKVFQIVTSPVVKTVRAITPKVVIDAHIPMLAFFLLFWVWFGLAVLRRYLCALNGLAC